MTRTLYTSSSIVLSIAACVLAGCTTQPKPLSEAASGKIHINSDITSTQTVNTAIPSGTPTLPGHGKEKSLAYGAVTGVDGTTANGVATVHYMEDGSTVVGGQVNIAIPEDGYFYEGWLQTDDDTQKISIGHLTNRFNDVRHAVHFESDKDLKAYTHMVVTLEADDGNTDQGKIVAKAILKPSSR